MANLSLWPYQDRATDFSYSTRRVYQMLDVGLGKTIIALKTIERAGLPTLVLAPLRVTLHTWPEEIKKWGLDLSYTVLHGPKKNIRLRLDRQVYLLNWDGLPWFYKACCDKKFKLRKMFMVFDESSFVKNHSTQRFKLLQKMMPVFSPYRMNLSATPAPNGLYELWSQYYLLDGGARLGKSYYKFRDRFFIYTGHPTYKTLIKPGSEHEIYRLVEDITYRMSAKDYLDLPEVVYNAIPLTLPPELQSQYDKFERDSYIDVNGSIIEANFAASRDMKLRQFVQGAMYTDEGTGRYVTIHQIKAHALKEIVDGAAGQPILCPIQFKFDYDILCAVFRKRLPIIAGQTNPRESIRLINEWNRGEIPLLLCHPRSIGHGLNLQSAGHMIIWYTLTWSLEDYIQLIGRLARQGQQADRVIVHHLLMQNTVDIPMGLAIGRKDATQSGLLEYMRDYIRQKYGV